MMMPEEIFITDEYNMVFDMIEAKTPMFYIQGSAGVGKSTLIGEIKKRYKDVVACGTTGIAGLNVGGPTMHKQFSFFPNNMSPKDLAKRSFSMLQEGLGNAKIIIIDEISMCSTEMIRGMFSTLDIVYGDHRPRPILIFVGDCYQLPPVNSDFFFQAPELAEGFPIIRLTTTFRQKDSHFVDMLMDVMVGGTKYLQEFNDRCVRKPDHFVPVLSTVRRCVKDFNLSELRKIKQPKYEYTGVTTGKFDLKHVTPLLHLKIGAKVVFLRNDPNDRWVNGSVGEVVGLRKDEVEVLTEGCTYKVLPFKWENVLGKKILGTFTQIPLDLAWSVTIHKSQGRSYTEALVDVSQGAFSCGQTYTALSRLRSLEGLYLTSPIQPSDVKTSTVVTKFFKDNRCLSRKNLGEV